jgi:hypothetical protein
MIFLGFFYYFKRIEKHIYFFSFPYGDLKQKIRIFRLYFRIKLSQYIIGQMQYGR